ncbi:14946_t:CDS:2 [Entrophospora sp. SA101]|nr:14946_t:CDS:2 [Entrophospora sp. SA101]
MNSLKVKKKNNTFDSSGLARLSAAALSSLSDFIWFTGVLQPELSSIISST